MTKKQNKILLFAFLGFMGAAIIFGLFYGAAVRSDMTGESVTHRGCTVTDKPTGTNTRGLAHEDYKYFVESTCGTFETERRTYEQIEMGQAYDLTTTVGNWANKPTILKQRLNN